MTTTSKLTTRLTTLGLLATLAASSLTPALADGYRSDGQIQASKNNARNLALGAAGVAVFGLLSHNNAATLIGAAGAALAGSQYEKDRREQSQDNGYYYRDGRGGDWNGGNHYGSNNGRNGSDQYGGSGRWDGGNGRSNWNGGNGRSNWNGGNGRADGDRSGSDNGGRSGWNGDSDRDNTDRDSDNQYGDNGGGDGAAWHHRSNQR